MTCPVCIIDYNKTTCAQITCVCDYSSCKTCVRTYLLSTTQEPHCMQCRIKWNYEFVKKNLGASFVNKELKEHTAKTLLDKAISKREEKLPQAIIHRDDQNDKKQIAELRIQVKEYQNKIEGILDLIEDINNNIRTRHGDVRYYRNYQRSRDMQHSPAPKKTKFIMSCQNPSCNGMIDEKYCCAICKHTTCSKCCEIALENHVCNPDTVETIKNIKKDSKPCPKCGISISKIDGCNQMWCVECHTGFSWVTGEIETNIHNPHYFEYMRKNGGMPPTPVGGGAAGGGGAYCFNQNYMRNVVFTGFSKKHEEDTKIIQEYIRYIIHIENVTIVEHQRSITNKNSDTNDILYILGEIDKETFKSKLISTHNAKQKEQVFLDIYNAIHLVGLDIRTKITPNCDPKQLVQSINKWSAYFNMQLINALMLYDSKRLIEIFKDGKLTYCKYENMQTMKTDLQLYTDIYNNLQ